MAMTSSVLRKQWEESQSNGMRNAQDAWKKRQPSGKVMKSEAPERRGWTPRATCALLKSLQHYDGKTAAEVGMSTCRLSAAPQPAGSVMVILLVYVSSLGKECLQTANVN